MSHKNMRSKMEPNTTKIILLVAMFLVTLVFGLIPIKVYRLLTDQRRTKLIPKTSYKSWLPSLIISLLTCFAGGVFLSIVFLDLLPDAEEAFKSLKEKNVWNVDYPVVQCIALLGFFLVFAVEELIGTLFSAHGHGHSHVHHDQTLVTNNPQIFDHQNENAGPASGSDASNCEIHGQHNHSVLDLDTQATSVKVVQSVIFTLALVIHCAFEGFAFGVQPSNFSVVSLFFGIMVHKCVVAFSVGLRLVRCHPHRIGLVITLIMIFVLTSPIFGAVGMLVEESSMEAVTKNKISTVFISASLGTFLYIAFFEMLAPEKENSHSPLLKMFATFCGFLVIAGVMTVSS